MYRAPVWRFLTCCVAGLPVQAGMAWRAGRATAQTGQAGPGPGAEALVLPRPGEGTAGTLQRSAPAGAEPTWWPRPLAINRQSKKE